MPLTVNFNKIILASSLLLLFTACNNSHLSVDRTVRAAQQNDGGNDASVTYYRDIQPLFKKNCANCHGEGSPLGDWLNYDVAFARKDRLMDRVVVKKDMPLGTSIADAERALVQQWLQLGAPAGKRPGQAENPPPSNSQPEPVPETPADPALPTELNYAKIKLEVFDKYCIACHNETSGPMIPSWNDYNVVFAKKDRIWQRAIVLRNMPIGDPIPEEAYNLLKIWIEQGAQN